MTTECYGSVVDSAARSMWFVSTVVPAMTTAGPLVLHRHLELLRAEGWTVDVVDLTRSTARLAARLDRSRFRRWSADGVALAPRLSTAGATLPRGAPHVVCTVAHGAGFHLAARLARRARAPLVTFFHDFWPDYSVHHRALHSLVEQRFRALYRSSSVALCVSSGMRRELGDHDGSLVLHPIPAPVTGEVVPPTAPSAARKARLLYAGNLTEYGAMLSTLLDAAARSPEAVVQVRGNDPSWSPERRRDARARGMWLPEVPPSEFFAWLQTGDALLVTMSFAPLLRRQMRTSFPSKLTQYCQLGRPIIIWGPSDATAVEWARAGDRAVCVTENDPVEVLRALQRLRDEPDRWRRYAEAAKAAARTDFDPRRIQAQLTRALDGVVGGRDARVPGDLA